MNATVSNETTEATRPGSRPIRLRGVRVHNLKNIDLDLPTQALTVICGVSGAGKSSLALDTLYAEGQRRYIESFPARTRQYLQRLDPPDADRIEAIPPAVAVTAMRHLVNRRATVSSAADIAPLLQLLFARLGHVACPDCGCEIRQDSPQTVARFLMSRPDARRVMIGFEAHHPAGESAMATCQRLVEDGFVRAVIQGRTVDLSGPDHEELLSGESAWNVIVDRLISGNWSADRLRDSLETAFTYGGGECRVWMEAADTERESGNRAGQTAMEIDGRSWIEFRFGIDWKCRSCGRSVPAPEPNLLNPHSSMGACATCKGLGTVRDWDLDWIVPDRTKSILAGAVRPWSEEKFPYRLGEFLAIADELGVRIDVPWCELTEGEQKIVAGGDQSGRFPGVLAQLSEVARKSKGAAAKRIDRWRGDVPCPDCRGARLRRESLAVTLNCQSIFNVESMPISAMQAWLERLEFEPWQEVIAQTILPQISRRLSILQKLGLGYLSLGRSLDSLSRGEAQRVAFAAALSSSLVNLLYVLDEPTVGLHRHDIQTLLAALLELRDRGNTVVVVDHDESLIQSADHVVEVGPQAGSEGGEIVFAGSVAELLESDESLTAAYLRGERHITHGESQRRNAQGWIQLRGASGHNLQQVDVDFPLGVLAVVTGVSGAGKSTLVHDTLYAELCRRKQKSGPKPLPFAMLEGSEQVEDVVWIDHRTPVHTARSNPVTYVKAFGEIRRVFAETTESRIHNYTPGHFSFNVEGGRCEECKGEGWLSVDMQFLSDARMVCPVCQGRRFRETILDITYRGRNIAQVLDMTAREAFRFFRGEKKVQSSLQRLLDVGLDYLRLGQPLDALSAGEAQRLKLAGQLAASRRRRTLYIMEEPSSGLHTADLAKLLDCFDSLLAVGHSLLLIEHHPALIQAADHVIDLGPGAAEEGGRLVAAGRPDAIAAEPASLTGRYLRELRGRYRGGD